MKIAFFNTSEEENIEIEEKFSSHEVKFFNGAVQDNLIDLKEFEAISVFVGNEIKEEQIDQLPNLKLISTRSTGYDHIDTEYTKEKGINVVNVPVYGARTVAEYAFSLIMALSRKPFAAYERLRESGETDVKDYEGFDLNKKTLGVIGTGNIGKNVARIGHGFGMKILLSDLHPDDQFAEEINAEYKSLEDVVAQSDVVSLHVPYIKATHHLINEEVLRKFKKGSIIINTSRGGIVDTEALLKVLNEGVLAGAGLDVVEGEEDFKDEISLLFSETNDIEKFRDLLAVHELVDMDNVIVTPHIAFNTKEAKEEILNTTLDNISSFIDGEIKNSVIKD